MPKGRFCPVITQSNNACLLMPPLPKGPNCRINGALQCQNSIYCPKIREERMRNRVYSTIFFAYIWLKINEAMVHYNAKIAFLSIKYAKQECMTGSIIPCPTLQLTWNQWESADASGTTMKGARHCRWRQTSTVTVAALRKFPAHPWVGEAVQGNTARLTGALCCRI